MKIDIKDLLGEDETTLIRQYGKLNKRLAIATTITEGDITSTIRIYVNDRIHSEYDFLNQTIIDIYNEIN